MAKMTRSLRVVMGILIAGLSLTLLVMLTTSHAVRANPGIIYVDLNAEGPAHDGLSWTTAFTELQSALAVASSGDEIWVGEGVYTPDLGPGQADNDPTSTFALKSGVALYGGFAGTETVREQRDWDEHLTVLSGDIDGNDSTDPAGVITTTAGITGTNSYHVVTGSGVTETAKLDGFTITAGQAVDPPNSGGGGMVIDNGSPALANVAFSGNQATSGGGIYTYEGSPTLTSVGFFGNSAQEGGGLYNAIGSPSIVGSTFSANRAVNGGGLYNDGDYLRARLTLTDVTFTENSAENQGGALYQWNTVVNFTEGVLISNTAEYGGGMYSLGGNLTLNQVSHTSNQATYHGGGMYSQGATLLITGSTFGGNVAGSNGGGIESYDSLAISIQDSVFSGNTAGDGGGIRGYSTLLTLTNVRFTGNLAAFDGGGIKTWGDDLILTDVSLTGNRANNAGGGLANFGSNTKLTNVTMAGNYAASSGGGMYILSSSPLVQNTIIWNNQSGTSTGDGIFNDSGGSPTIRYSLVEGCNPSGVWGAQCGTDGGDNPVDGDPLFANPVNAASAPTEAGDYRLTGTSPALQAGDNLADLDGADPSPTTISDIPWDLDGNPRIFNTLVDLGPYEHPSLYCPGGGVLYVDVNATGDNTGTSWENAYVHMQDALRVSEPCEIWVAGGTHYPDGGEAIIPNDRDAGFTLKSGVAIYGGFAGTETARDQRDWSANVTVLSGDIDGNDIADATGVVTRAAQITGMNSYHVVAGNDVDTSAVLDGFSITAGQANGQGAYAPSNNSDCGGGMVNVGSSPTLANLHFSGNIASGNGGGMADFDGSSPTLANVTFSGNQATYGGGLYNTNSHESLVDVTFSHNAAVRQGGGMYVAFADDVTLLNVLFSGNTAGTYGGGLSADTTIADLTSVAFYANQADSWGGGCSATAATWR